MKNNKKNYNQKKGGKSYDYNLNGKAWVDGQNSAELKQFGPLYGNDFDETVGRPLGATTQLMADSTSFGTGGGKKKKKKKRWTIY